MASCPASFQPHPVLPSTCVAECSPEFQVRIVDGVPRCVHTGNASISYQLNPLSLPVTPEQAAGESERARGEAAIQLERIGNEERIRSAFQRLQDAENARDQAPEAYQVARNQYYTLTKGDTWVAEETERVSRAEVAPLVAQYTSMYNDLMTRLTQQQQTSDIVTGVKDKVVSLKDEFEYSVDTMGKQLDDLKNQINMERRTRKEASAAVLDWMDILLNILIIVIFFVVIGVIYRRVSRASTLGATTYG